VLGEYGVNGLNHILKFIHTLVAVAIDEERWSAIHPATHAAKKLRFDDRCEFAALESGRKVISR